VVVVEVGGPAGGELAPVLLCGDGGVLARPFGRPLAPVEIAFGRRQRPSKHSKTPALFTSQSLY
jgi:hypothetical protein